MHAYFLTVFFRNSWVDNEKNSHKNIEKILKKELLSYFLNFNAIFAAIAQDNTVNPIGNIPLVRICGTCSNDAMLPLEYIAAATGKATSPTTPSFVFVFSETVCCMLYVLIVII